MDVIIEDARDSYDEDIVVELQSNSMEDLENNCEKISKWFENYPNSKTKSIFK